LPDGTIANLLKPENKALIIKILTYNIVPGKLTAKYVKAAIQKVHGTAQI